MKKLLILTLISSFQSYSYDDSKVINHLIVNPVQVLNTNQLIRKEIKKNSLYQQFLRGEITHDNPSYIALRQKYEEHAPLFLLGECTKEDTGECVLSRFKYPLYRLNYEQAVVDALIKKSESNELIEYVSFGSGGLFQDIVILSKFLTKKPNAKMHIHCIDTQYYAYVTYLLLIGCTADMETPVDRLDDVMEIILEDAKDSFPGKSDSEICQTIKQICSINFEKNNQFTRFIRINFPNAQLSFCIHNYYRAYFAYLKERSLRYPDVITASDIEYNNDTTALDDYKTLCLESLRYKHNENILLSKGNTCLTNLIKFSAPAHLILESNE